MDQRLSYLHASDNSVVDDELKKMFNPIINLSETFNSLVAEEGSHLKVFLRVRPILPSEKDSVASEEPQQVQILDKHTVLLTAPSSSNTFKNTSHGITKLTHRFSFSQVYGPATSQVELYDFTTKSMVNKFISGQNCLLFTYGATNSGKTYTVQGATGQQGILPRALDGVFASISGKLYPRRDLKPQYYCALICLDDREVQLEEERKEALFNTELSSSMSRSTLSVNTTAGSRRQSPDNTLDLSTTDNDITSYEDRIVYAVFVTFAEIYNETVFDLLERLPPGCKKRNVHTVGEDRNGSSYIKGLHDVRVDSASEALRVLEIGRQNLHFATTRLNHNSSRSHCIFTVKLVQMASVDTPKYARVSMFSVCDLAGAERVAKTQGTGERLKEAGNINTSLLTLSRCIVALRQNQLSQRSFIDSSLQGNRRREVPVPYRDSKLTRLLQTFFLGQGVAAMIVNISQAPQLFDETLQVLKFSAVAKKVITSNEAAPMPQPVRKSHSQLARFMRQSLNKSFRSKRSTSSIISVADSGRLSVPWMDKTTGKPNASVNMTFGEDVKEESMMTVMEEEEDDESDEEEDERVQSMTDHMNKLSAALMALNTEKKQLEVRLRSQLCSEFSRQLVEVETDWRRRMEKQQAQSDELHDWRIAKLTEYYTASTQPRKRPRTDDDGDCTAALDDSLLQCRQRGREEQLEQQVCELQDCKAVQEAELATLKATLKKTTEAGHRAQEQATKLKFQLATLTQNFDAVTLQLESSQRLAESAAVSESSAVAELQRQLTSSQSSLLEVATELQSNREMLMEAAEAYAGKEEEVDRLCATLTQYKRALADQSVSLEQQVQELAAAQALTSEHITMLEDRETSLEEAHQQLAALKQSVNELRRDAAKADSNGEQERMATREHQATLVREKSKLLLELSLLKSELQKSRAAEAPLQEEGFNLENKRLGEQVQQLQQDCRDQDALLQHEREQCELLKKLQQESLEKSSQEGTEEVNAIKCQLTELKQKLGSLESDNSELLNVKAEAAVTEGKHKADLSQLTNLLEGKICQLEKLQTKYEELSLEYKSDGEASKTTLEQYQNLIVDSQQKRKALKADLDNTKERFDELSGNMKQLQSLKVAHEEQQVTAKEEVDTLQETITSLQRENRSHHKTVLDLTTNLEHAEELRMQHIKDKEIKCKLVTAEKETVLQNLIDTKSELAQQLEDIKSENTKLCLEVLQKTTECDKILYQLETRVHEMQSNVDSLTEQLSKEQEDFKHKLDDKKKVHISTVQYKDCELSSLKREVADLRQQLGKFREEREDAVRDAVGAASKDEQEATEAVRQQLEELQLKYDHAATSDSDRAKINKLKDDLKKSRETCLMLQKEASAVREARSVEVLDLNNLRSLVSVLQSSVQTKDEEIVTLQVEVKKALSCTTMLAVPSPAPAPVPTPRVTVKVEQVELTEEEKLKEQLRAKEAQVSNLLQQLSVSRRLEAHASPHTSPHTTHTSPHTTYASPHTTYASPHTTYASPHTTHTSPDNTHTSTKHLDQLPPPSSSRRMKAARAVTAVRCSESDTSVTDPPSPAKHNRRQRPQTPQHASPTQQEAGVMRTSTRLSTRKMRAAGNAAIAILTTTDEGGDDDAASDGNDWVPVLAPVASRHRKASNKRVSKARKTPRIYNPHLDNQENRSSVANHCDDESNEPSTANKTIGRTQRRRVLYRDEGEELYCSPNLIAPLPPMDSPHTLVKRKLRTKPAK